MEGGVIRGRLYHGSASPQDVLSPEYGSEYGIYLTPSRRYARSYGDVVHTVLTNVKSPLTVADKSEISPRDLTLADIQRLEAQGYDSIASLSGNGKITELVVFRPENVHIMEKNPVSDVVYHRTSLNALVNLLETNRFLTTPAGGSVAERLINKGRDYYFSTMRSPQGDYPGSITLLLDGRKLSQRYKGAPVDYWGPTFDKNEMEDRIFTNLPYIENAASYIKEIHVSPGFSGTAGSYRKLGTCIELAEGFGIPLFEYHTEITYDVLTKSKARKGHEIEGVSGPIPLPWAVERLMGLPEGYVPPLREPAAFADYLSHVLEGKSLDPANKSFGQWDKRIRYYSQARKTGGRWLGDKVSSSPSDTAAVLSTVLHNNKSDYNSRKPLHKIITLMRKAKAKTPQEFVDYLRETLEAKESHTKNPLAADTSEFPATFAPADEHLSAIRRLYRVNLHEGVHVTLNPEAAIHYGLQQARYGRRKGKADVIHGGILIGLADLGRLHPDADVYYFATNLYNYTTTKSRIDKEDILGEMMTDPSFGLYDVARSGLGMLTHQIRPLEKEARAAIRRVSKYKNLPKKQFLSKCLEEAAHIVPQRRVLKDVGEDKVRCVLLLPNTHPGYNEELPKSLAAKMLRVPQIAEWEQRPDDTQPELISQFILNNSTVVWGDFNDARYWHGLSADSAKQALPKIFTPKLMRIIKEESSTL
jgi:hypothetical protein